MLSISPAFAASVTSVDPQNASHTASTHTVVNATLDGTASGATAQTFVVRSSQAALATSFSPSSAGNDAIIDPTIDFHSGERVQATVTSGVLAGGVGVTPYVWSFRTRVLGGNGVFSHSGASLGNNSSSAVSLGDVDGDGDLGAFVARWNVSDRLWLNDGSGSFVDTSQNIGNYTSLDVSLGDVDGDGDLDAFVANFYPPNRV